MRLAFIECAAWPFTLTVHGNTAVSGQSGVHWPVTGSRESPLPDRPHSTSRVRTGVTTGICWVSTVGTTLGSGVVETRVVPGASTLGTEPTTVNCMIAPTQGSLGSPA